MRRLVVSTLAVLLATAGGPAVASDHDDREAAISLDGRHFQSAIGEPLFDPAFHWVPGDVEVASFWVRNQADAASDLTIDLVPRTRADLFDSGYLTVSARASNGAWRTVRSGRPLRLLTRDDLPAQATVPVDIRVAVAPHAPNGTMVLGTDFALEVTLVDARAGGTSDGPSGPGGVLPDTGAALSWWAVPLGLILLAAGLLLLARRESAQPLPVHPS